MPTAAAGVWIMLAATSGLVATAQATVRTTPPSAKTALTVPKEAQPASTPDPPDVDAARKRLAAFVKGTSTMVGRFQLLPGVRPPGGATLHGTPRGVHAGPDRNYWNVASNHPLDAILPAQAGATHAVVVVNGWTDAAHSGIWAWGETLVPKSDTQVVQPAGVVTGSGVFRVLPGPFHFGFAMGQYGQFGHEYILGVTSCTVYFFAVH